MDRIGPAGGSPTVALTDGEQGFVDENLSTGQEGINVPALWMNALMEELLNLIVLAGITPDINNWTQIYQAILNLINQTVGTLFDAYFDGSGNFYFVVPVPGGSPLIIQGGPGAVPAANVSAQQLLPLSFPHAFKGGVCTDDHNIAYQYGIAAGTDLSHCTIYCPLDQLISGSITARGDAGCFFICWGN